jgi:hypothetical protein
MIPRSWLKRIDKTILHLTFLFLTLDKRYRRFPIIITLDLLSHSGAEVLSFVPSALLCMFVKYMHPPEFSQPIARRELLLAVM